MQLCFSRIISQFLEIPDFRNFIINAFYSLKGRKHYSLKSKRENSEQVGDPQQGIKVLKAKLKANSFKAEETTGLRMGLSLNLLVILN